MLYAHYCKLKLYSIESSFYKKKSSGGCCFICLSLAMTLELSMDAVLQLSLIETWLRVMQSQLRRQVIIPSF